MTLTGDLTEVGIKELIGLVEDLKATGKLVIKNAFLVLVIYFKNGKPVNSEGDKGPVETMERIIGLEKGSFEFEKMDDVPTSQSPENLSKVVSRIDEIKDQWKKIKSRFPTQNIIVDISQSKNDNEIKMSSDEWRILSSIREPLYLSELVKISPFGELKTLSVISSLDEKKLIILTLEKEDRLKPEDEVIPIKTAGWFAINSPIYGEKNIEFYKKIDNKKDFITIVKEMGINYKEGKDILKYLLSQGKIALKKKPK